MNKISYIIKTAFVLLLLASCTTGKGSLYKDIASIEDNRSTSDSTNNDSGSSSGSNSGNDTDNGSSITNTPSSSPEIEYPEEEVEEKTPALIITSNPSGADVYIDGTYRGTTPLTIEYPYPKYYLIRIEKDGYYSEEANVYHNGLDQVYVHKHLNEIVGYLHLDVPDRTMRYSEYRLHLRPGLNQLPIGTYSVDLQVFGYEPYTIDFVIYENQTTTISPSLTPSAFKVYDLFSNKKVFNPANNGALGNYYLNYQVSNDGELTLLISDNEGNAVYKEIKNGFQKWNQSFKFDGNDSSGNQLPDGKYRLQLMWEEDGKSESKEIYFEIDSSLVIGYNHLFNGVSGMLFAPDTNALPDGYSQSSIGFVSHGSDGIYRTPAFMGARIGLAKDLEVAVQGNVYIYNDERTPPGGASISIKRRLSSHSVFSSAIYAKLAYHSESRTDTMTNYTGLSAGIPVSLHFKHGTINFAPEIVVSNSYPNYTHYKADEEIDVWMYGRMGLMFNMDFLQAGISGAVRTPRFNDFDYTFPISAGLEGNMNIPDSPLYFSILGAMEYRASDDYYVMAGVEFGLLF